MGLDGFYGHIWSIRYDFPNIPIWITEYADTSADPAGTFLLPTDAFLVTERGHVLSSRPKLHEFDDNIPRRTRVGGTVCLVWLVCGWIYAPIKDLLLILPSTTRN